jgi:hypothetical protein
MELLDDRAAILDMLLLTLAVVRALPLEGPRQADIFPRVLWVLHDVVPDHRIDRGVAAVTEAGQEGRV